MTCKKELVKAAGVFLVLAGWLWLFFGANLIYGWLGETLFMATVKYWAVGYFVPWGMLNFLGIGLLLTKSRSN